MEESWLEEGHVRPVPLRALVRQDFRLSCRRPRLNQGWWMLYVIGVAVLAVGFATYFGRRGDFDPRPVWFATLGFVFAGFGFGIGVVTNEWKNSTVGWWLSLPVPRWRLAASKWMSALLRGWLLLLVVCVALALLGLYALALGGRLNPAEAARYLGFGAAVGGLVAAVLPGAAAFGVFYGAIAKSRWRPAIPLIWLAVSGSWWLVAVHHGSPQAGAPAAGGPDGFGPLWTASTWQAVLASWLVGFGLVGAAAHVLDRRLQL
ncbi:MAG: ABC transporter permease subunit [Alicyclobacillaceae bacterium]|nr:ABC transporter permease subunit [Alicyclobacillaceae bacterium]